MYIHGTKAMLKYLTSGSIFSLQLNEYQHVLGIRFASVEFGVSERWRIYMYVYVVYYPVQKTPPHSMYSYAGRKLKCVSAERSRRLIEYPGSPGGCDAKHCNWKTSHQKSDV